MPAEPSTQGRREERSDGCQVHDPGHSQEPFRTPLRPAPLRGARSGRSETRCAPQPGHTLSRGGDGGSSRWTSGTEAQGGMTWHHLLFAVKPHRWWGSQFSALFPSLAQSVGSLWRLQFCAVCLSHNLLFGDVPDGR